jgi:hypothetical protein
LQLFDKIKKVKQGNEAQGDKHDSLYNFHVKETSYGFQRAAPW